MFDPNLIANGFKEVQKTLEDVKSKMSSITDENERELAEKYMNKTNDKIQESLNKMNSAKSLEELASIDLTGLISLKDSIINDLTKWQQKQS